MTDPTLTNLSEGDRVRVTYTSVTGNVQVRRGEIRRILHGEVPTAYKFDPDDRDTVWTLQAGRLYVRHAGMWGTNVKHRRVIGHGARVAFEEPGDG